MVIFGKTRIGAEEMKQLALDMLEQDPHAKAMVEHMATKPSRRIVAPKKRDRFMVLRVVGTKQLHVIDTLFRTRKVYQVQDQQLEVSKAGKVSLTPGPARTR